MLALAGGGVLLAVVIAVAVLGNGTDSPPPGPTTGLPTPDALEPGPGMPTVTARSIGDQQVEFSWKYDNPVPSDSFRVKVIEDGKSVMTKKPDLVLPVAQGQQACIQVWVISAHGVESTESSLSCWPKS